MISRTKRGKFNIRKLNDSRVEEINEVFDEINDLVSELYESVFDMEDVEKVKKELITSVNKVKNYED